MSSLLWSLLNCKEFHSLRIYSGRETNRTSVFATDLNQRVQQSIEPACSSIQLKLQSASVPLQNSSSNSNIEKNCWNYSKSSVLNQCLRHEIEPACSPQILNERVH